ncbi:MAG TPA: hypothetical protein VGS06_06490 [Streptosporangiaceae bacterium]|nr:hypothetical protein [Streptosporangiaceae bacterium]
MSIRSKVLAAAATLTLVSGVGAAGALTAGTASAATPSCGNACINVFSKEFGTHHQPNFVVDVLRQGEKVGQPIILFRTANFDPAEDFSVAFQGTVADFFAAGLVSSAVALHYGCLPSIFPGGSCFNAKTNPHGFPNDFAFENEYAPFGVDSGLCLGVAATAFNDEGVTLQPCGVSAKTVWIVDTFDSPVTLFNGFVPLINGSDTNFSHPFVLTYPNNSVPTDKPRPQLVVTNLTGFQNGPGPVLGTVNVNQLWGATFGVLP